MWYSYRKHLYDGEFVGIGVSGAEINYWGDKQKLSMQSMFPVEFKHAGWGVVRIVVCNINGSLEIQSVDYGLPASEKSKALIENTNKEQEI